MRPQFKVIVGPSPHYRQLRSGEIRHQKSRPNNPIWRILIIDETRNLLHSRAYATQPAPEEIDRVVMGVLSAQDLLISGVVIPNTVEKMCLGLQQRIIDCGGKVYLPAHGFAAGSRICRESDDFFEGLDMYLREVRESTASCEELALAAGNPLGVVTTKLWEDGEAGGRRWDVAQKLAHDIARFRGRDPEVGRRMRKNESFLAPLNKGRTVPPRQDVLSTLLTSFRHPNLGATRFGTILFLLQGIREAKREEKLSLFQKLGQTAILYQIDGLRHGPQNFLLELGVHLRDEALQHLISLGMMEALKIPIVLDEGLLQVSAARVRIHYLPHDCRSSSLRGIPAHHPLEKMVQQLSGGDVVIIPDLASESTMPPEFLQSLWPLGSSRLRSRSQLRPKGCVIPVSQGGSQRREGLLTVIAILPKDTTTCFPIGDRALASRMTAVVNERLERNSVGVLCEIEPLQPYGNMMDIG